MRSVFRKIVFVLLILGIGVTKIYADEATYTEGDIFECSVDEYIPEYVSEVLADMEFENNKLPNVQDVIKGSLEKFKSDVFDNKYTLVIIIVLILISTLIKTISRGNFNATRVFVIKLSITVLVINEYTDIMMISEQCTNNLLDLINTVSPAFAAVYLLSGATFSATVSSASISVLINIVTRLFGTPVFDISMIMVCLFISEVFAPNSVNISKTLKKSLISMIGFVFSLLITVISLNGMLAASKDSVSLRMVKFATVKLVPVIGSSVSEAMKNITVGISTIRTQLGGYIMCALLILVLPAVLKLMFFKLTMKFLALLSSALSVNECDSIFEGFSDMSDVFMAIIIGMFISMLLLLIIFCSHSVSL